MAATGVCTGRNGGYVCQFEFAHGRHDGMHYCYYRSADGTARIAYWVDQYSQVKAIRAPVPKLPPRNK